jgi:hypothetical protein
MRRGQPLKLDRSGDAIGVCGAVASLSRSSLTLAAPAAVTVGLRLGWPVPANALASAGGLGI